MYRIFKNHPHFILVNRYVTNYPYKQNKIIEKNDHFKAQRRIAHTLVLFLLTQLYLFIKRILTIKANKNFRKCKTVEDGKNCIFPENFNRITHNFLKIRCPIRCLMPCLGLGEYYLALRDFPTF